MPRRPFGACLTKTLFDAKAQGILRELDVVEWWSGVGSIASAAQKAGYKVATVDLIFGEDLTTREGFEDAVNKVLRLKPGGLLSMGIECKSFVFLNSSNCERNFYNQYAGDTKYEPVKTGNLFANEGKFFAELGFARDLVVVIENPPSSVLWSYLPASFMKKLPYSAVCNRCAFDDAPDGKRLSKKYKFFPMLLGLQPSSAHAHAFQTTSAWPHTRMARSLASLSCWKSLKLTLRGWVWSWSMLGWLMVIWVCLMWMVNPVTHLTQKPSEQGPGRAWSLLPQFLDLLAAVAGSSCESSSNSSSSSKLQSFWS